VQQQQQQQQQQLASRLALSSGHAQHRGGTYVTTTLLHRTYIP
jgi:hypothetical protein